MFLSEKNITKPIETNKKSIFSFKTKKFLDKLTELFENESLLLTIRLIEEDKIRENIDTFTWFLSYFLLVDKNYEILKEILHGYMVEITKLWSLSTKNIIIPSNLTIKDLEIEFNNKNPLIISKIITFFLENKSI